MKTIELCESLCRETVEKLGFVLWDVEFQKEYGDWVGLCCCAGLSLVAESGGSSLGTWASH